MKGGDKINYFFKIVVPQLLEYFESNAEDVSKFLILDVLKNNKSFEKVVQDVIDLSKEISNKNKK